MSLSGNELIRIAVLKNERLQTRTERNSGLAGNHRGKPGAAGCCGKEVAITIDDVYTSGVLNDNAEFSAASARYRRAIFDCSRAMVHGCVGRIDQGPSLLGVFAREK